MREQLSLQMDTHFFSRFSSRHRETPKSQRNTVKKWSPLTSATETAAETQRIYWNKNRWNNQNNCSNVLFQNATYVYIYIMLWGDGATDIAAIAVAVTAAAALRCLCVFEYLEWMSVWRIALAIHKTHTTNANDTDRYNVRAFLSLAWPLSASLSWARESVFFFTHNSSFFFRYFLLLLFISMKKKTIFFPSSFLFVSLDSWLNLCMFDDNDICDTASVHSARKRINRCKCV